MITRLLLPVLAGVVLSIPVPQARSQANKTVATSIEAKRSLLTRFAAPSRLGKTSAALFGVGEITREGWDGSDWYLQSRTKHTYSGSRRTDTWDYEWIGVEWTPSVRTTYDENGMIRTVDLWDPTSQAPSPWSQYSYEFSYDLINNRSVVSAVLEQEWDGTAWLDRHRTTFQVEIDPSDGLRIVGGQTEARGLSTWVPLESFSLTQVGSDVVQEYREWDGAAWVNSDRIIFPDHSIRSLSTRMDYLAMRYGDFIELQLGLLMLPEGIYQEWNGADWENVSRQSVEWYHFATGDPGAFLFEFWDGTDWVAEARLELAFELSNSRWRIAASDFQTPWQFGWTTVIRELYQHDGRGLLVGATQLVGFGGIVQNNARQAYSWQDLSVGRDDPDALPSKHSLAPAYPNPFNPTTTFAYRLAANDVVRIEVRDALGRLVRVLVDQPMAAGDHRVTFDADNLPSGLYAVQMSTTGQRETRLVTLLK